MLAAILVPQGMAYAELAGLPPVTGLYTTIGCLLGYAVFGPSRILVLGPDSSISPMIFAALVPLLVAGGDPHRAIALAGMLAVIVALIEIGLGVARARVRRRPPLQRGAGRLHERPGPGDHRRAAAEALRLLDRRRGLRARGQGLLHRSRTGPSARRSRRPRRPRHPARPPPLHQLLPAVLVGIVVATVVSARLRSADSTACRPWAPCRGASRRPRSPGRSSPTSGP